MRTGVRVTPVSIALLDRDPACSGVGTGRSAGYLRLEYQYVARRGVIGKGAAEDVPTC